MKDLRASLETALADHPVLAAVVVAAGLRLVAALTCNGWFASDDYLYVIEPAWRWLAEPAAAFPSHYRSPLLARLVSASFRLAQGLGLDGPTSSLHVAYVLLGLWSLLALPGVYRLAQARLGETAARQVIWLMAAQVIVPTIATRALIEVVCIPPLVWGLVWADGAGVSRHPAGQGLAAGLALGLAAILRFQTGLVAVAVLAWLVFAVVRLRAVDVGRASPRALLGFAGGGVAALLLQGLVDLSLGRDFLDTPLTYLGFNLTHASEFGISPWYTYLLQLLVFTVPPVTLWLAKPLWRACGRHGVVSLSFGVFLLAHSVVGHKEDRFLFPVLPLFFVLLGAALAELRVSGRGGRIAWLAFWGVNLVAVGIAVTADAQRAVTAPLLAIRAQGGEPRVAFVGFREAPGFYLGRGATWVTYREPSGLVDSVESEGARPTAVLSRLPFDGTVLTRLAAAGVECGAPTEFAGDLVDRLLLAVNAEHNRRRRPTTLWRCQESRVP